MSYIENLLGSPVIPEVQESLGLAAGNYKIKGFNLYASGDLVILDEGLALVDGLRIVSSANLKLSKSSVLNKYVFLRIYTYTETIDGLNFRKANLSLIAQTSSTPVNNTNLYDNIVGTKDVLLAYVNGSGVVDLTTNGALGVYDIPTRLTSVESVNTSQDSSISSLGTRMTAVETKNTSQDTSITSLGTRATNLETRTTNLETRTTNLETRATNIESKNTTQDTRLTNIETKNTEQDTRLTTLEADTGWINVPAATGYTSTVKYRLANGIIYFKGVFTKNSGDIVTGDLMGVMPTSIFIDERSGIGLGVGSMMIKIIFRTPRNINAQVSTGTATTYTVLDNIVFNLR